MAIDEATAEIYASFSDIELIFESILADYRALETQTEVMARKLTNIERSVI